MRSRVTKTVNHQLIIGAPLLLLTAFCFSYFQFVHPTQPHAAITSSTAHTAKRPASSQPLVTSETPLTPLTNAPVTAQNQPLPTSSASQIPNPTNTSSPQNTMKSNQLLPNNGNNNQSSSNPQKSLLHLTNTVDHLL